MPGTRLETKGRPGAIIHAEGVCADGVEGASSIIHAAGVRVGFPHPRRRRHLQVVKSLFLATAVMGLSWDESVNCGSRLEAGLAGPIAAGRDRIQVDQ